MCANIYRPAKRAHFNFQFAFQFVKDIKWIPSFPIQLIDKYNHRRFPHTTHFHQLSCLLLNAFGNIHYDNDAINSGQSPISVFCEILVSRRVEYIYFIIAIIKSHD